MLLPSFYAAISLYIWLMKRSSTVTFGNRFLRNLMIFCNLTAGLPSDRIFGRSKPLPYRESVSSTLSAVRSMRIVDLISVEADSISARCNDFCSAFVPAGSLLPSRREAEKCLSVCLVPRFVFPVGEDSILPPLLLRWHTSSTTSRSPFPHWGRH